MSWDLIIDTVKLVGLGAVSVTLWTVRVALTARGRRLVAALLAGIEAVVFALAFASVLSSLNAPIEIAGYAVGVATGTMLGVALDAQFSTGQSAVRIVADGHSEALLAALRAQGWPVARLQGDGVRGRIALLLVLVDDRQLPAITAALNALAPDAFWSIERVQRVKAVPFEGYRQIGRSHRFPSSP
jgi:uncharacterized protein YebE (UPF0316 family)